MHHGGEERLAQIVHSRSVSFTHSLTATAAATSLLVWPPLFWICQQQKGNEIICIILINCKQNPFSSLSKSKSTRQNGIKPSGKRHSRIQTPYLCVWGRGAVWVIWSDAVNVDHRKENSKWVMGARPFVNAKPERGYETLQLYMSNE